MSVPWGPSEKFQWLSEQKVQRSYENDVVEKIERLRATLDVTQYGSLSYDPLRYPLFVIKSRNFDENKKTILITGGVHGYETSGVHGALSFMQNEVQNYTDRFNIICFPCISPWAYETINRWNPQAVDPNRSFRENSPSEECSFFISALKSHDNILAHIDLHETTDTDNSIFRPTLAKRDGKAPEKLSEIPDGFYLVGDADNPQPEFQKAIIDAVRKVTHIAEPDAHGNLIGDKMEQVGVINYDKKKLFLCGGVSNAKYVTTTEVYPDSPKATPEICIAAQVAAIKGALDFLLSL